MTRASSDKYQWLLEAQGCKINSIQVLSRGFLQMYIYRRSLLSPTFYLLLVQVSYVFTIINMYMNLI